MYKRQTVCGAKAENAAEVPVNVSEPAIEPVQPEADENNSVTEEQSNELQNEVKTDEVSESPQNEKEMCIRDSKTAPMYLLEHER